MVQKCIITIFETSVVVTFEPTEVQNMKLELRMCRTPVIFWRKGSNDVSTMVWRTRVLPGPPQGRYPPQPHRLPLFGEGSAWSA